MYFNKKLMMFIKWRDLPERKDPEKIKNMNKV